MPKKSAATRGGTQRQKPKAQKSFELVHPVTLDEEISESAEEQQVETVEEQIEAPVAKAKARTARSSAAVVTVTEQEKKQAETSSSATPGSAAARIAARRQATQRVQQRNAQSLLSPEHFSYVRRDLITIAVLACLMLAIILTLYFTIGKTL